MQVKYVQNWQKSGSFLKQIILMEAAFLPKGVKCWEMYGGEGELFPYERNAVYGRFWYNNKFTYQEFWDVSSAILE